MCFIIKTKLDSKSKMSSVGPTLSNYHLLETVHQEKEAKASTTVYIHQQWCGVRSGPHACQEGALSLGPFHSSRNIVLKNFDDKTTF
jgi:hypothetical protein